MIGTDTGVDDYAKIAKLLVQLRESLEAWNSKYGHPFSNIADGTPVVIDSKSMPACRAFADRSDLIAALPKGGIFAEVGSYFGTFSVKILSLNSPKELHIFDWNLHLIPQENRSILDSHHSVYYHDGDPFVSASSITSPTFDVVYLNKSKDFGTVQRELDFWWSRLRTNGYLIVNDFTAWDPVQGIPYGVLAAVSQFVNENNLEIVFVSLQGRGFLNVAIYRSN